MELVKYHPKLSFKYCPSCGKMGNFDSKEFAFKCNSCDFHFFLNASAAVTALIFNEKGELLFTRRGIEPAFGMLDLPGGFVDPGESIENAIVREVKEELDLEVDKIEFYASFPNQYVYSGYVVNTVDSVFKCTINDFAPITYRDDISGYEFLNIKNVNQKEIAFKSVKAILNRLITEFK